MYKINTSETTNTIANIIRVLRTNVTLSNCVKYGVNNVPATTNCAKSYFVSRAENSSLDSTEKNKLLLFKESK